MTNKRFELLNNDGIPSWLEEFYNKFLPDSGLFVEVGIGHTIDRHWTKKKTLDSLARCTPVTQRCGSNTLDLLEYDFSGIYIDPVKEFCEEVRLITAGKNVKILNFGCSDKEETLSLYGGETFIENPHATWPGGVNYIGRQVLCRTLSSILEEEAPDQPVILMSIDVEGWEMKVLKGIKEEHMPKIMIIEIDKSAGVHNEMLRRGYTLCYQDSRDAAYVKKEGN